VNPVKLDNKNLRFQHHASETDTKEDNRHTSETDGVIQRRTENSLGISGV